MSVSIIGCGWLGQALASKLLSSNIDVIASYQSPLTQEKLTKLNIPNTPLVLPIKDKENKLLLGDESSDLFKQKVMIIAIPPQIKKGKQDYPLKITQLVELAEQGLTEQIIFLNSTAIYNGLQGEVTEDSLVDENAEKVSILLAAEQAVKMFSKKTHIVRLAGLVGPDRHPGRFLQANKVFTNGNSWVNLVHQSDVVNIIIELIQQNKELKSDIFNVVSSTHFKRKAFYQHAAKVLRLPIPKFDEDDQNNEGKKIKGDKLKNVINYQYQHDNLWHWV